MGIVINTKKFILVSIFMIFVVGSLHIYFNILSPTFVKKTHLEKPFIPENIDEYKIFKEGEEIISFGKHKGKVIEDLFKTEPGYFSWIQNADFPKYTKKVLRDLKVKIKNKDAGPITGDSLDMLKNKFNTK